MTGNARALFLVSTALSFMAIGPVYAEDGDADTIKALREEIAALQQQQQKQNALINELAEKVDAQEKTQAAVVLTQVQSKAATTDGGGREILPGVKATVGGFIEAAGIERSKNETTDIASNFNTAIPFNNSVNAHQSEFRGTARQSRITLLLEGNADDATKLSGYVESDFLGAAPTANSTESNSYNPRLRVLYAAVDQNDWGLHFLAGQSWSLLTTNKTGIAPRTENIPLTIDAQYVPGFNWTRNPQLRVVKTLDDDRISLGLSAESPQANLGGITVPGNVNATNTGVSPLSSASYSTDLAPDIIAKAAFDPGWGHFETFGLMRFFHDNVSSTFHNNTYVGGGGGVAAIMPVVSGKLDLQANAMYGEGIGRYGSAQLPDFAFAPNGALKPLTELTWMVGAVGHPGSTWDVYLYGGEESVRRFNANNTTYGYGDFALNNSGCLVENGSCSAQTANIWQITPGVWKQIYKGSFGVMKIGLQDSVTRRIAFSDSNGIAPSAYENTAMISFRFYPQ